MANIFDPVFDQNRGNHQGFLAKRAVIGRQAGTTGLGLSLWDLPPGQAAYPYHFHLADEELIVVLEGRPSLRTPDGWRELEPGEVVPFATGEQGAHQLVNWTEETVRFLAFSTSGHPDVVVYPDSRKVGAAERRGGHWAQRVRYSEEGRLDYWDGETPPERP